jgi:hypothetical protein
MLVEGEKDRFYCVGHRLRRHLARSCSTWVKEIERIESARKPGARRTSIPTTGTKQSISTIHFLAFLPEDGLNLLNLNCLNWKLTDSSEAACCGVVCSGPFEEQPYPGTQ